jgi:hypothetical protein
VAGKASAGRDVLYNEKVVWPESVWRRIIYRRHGPKSARGAADVLTSWWTSGTGAGRAPSAITVIAGR